MLKHHKLIMRPIGVSYSDNNWTFCSLFLKWQRNNCGQFLHLTRLKFNRIIVPLLYYMFQFLTYSIKHYLFCFIYDVVYKNNCIYAFAENSNCTWSHHCQIMPADCHYIHEKHILHNTRVFILHPSCCWQPDWLMVRKGFHWYNLIR